jgi:hypothetical protein
MRHEKASRPVDRSNRRIPGRDAVGIGDAVDLLRHADVRPRDFGIIRPPFVPD